MPVKLISMPLKRGHLSSSPDYSSSVQTAAPTIFHLPGYCRLPRTTLNCPQISKGNLRRNSELEKTENALFLLRFLLRNDFAVFDPALVITQGIQCLV